MIRTLLIDDEVAPRADLRRLLAAHADVMVVGEAATFGEALALLRTASYQLVFLDVRLIGGNGLELLEFARPEARVIFCTASDAYALRAFEVNALDYLLKPVELAQLAAALARARVAITRHVGGAVRAGVGSGLGEAGGEDPLVPPAAEGDVLHLRSDAQTSRLVAVSDICTVSAAGNYTTVQLPGDRSVLVRKTMKDWIARLPAAQFVRVHRSEFVNVRRVRRVKRKSVSSYELSVEGLSRPIRASYRYAAALRAALPELWT
jgi:two-component system, LytTR family, response regulator